MRRGPASGKAGPEGVETGRASESGLLERTLQIILFIGASHHRVSVDACALFSSSCHSEWSRILRFCFFLFTYYRCSGCPLHPWPSPGGRAPFLPWLLLSCAFFSFEIGRAADPSRSMNAAAHNRSTNTSGDVCKRTRSEENDEIECSQRGVKNLVLVQLVKPDDADSRRVREGRVSLEITSGGSMEGWDRVRKTVAVGNGQQGDEIAAIAILLECAELFVEQIFFCWCRWRGPRCTVILRWLFRLPS